MMYLMLYSVHYSSMLGNIGLIVYLCSVRRSDIYKM